MAKKKRKKKIRLEGRQGKKNLRAERRKKSKRDHCCRFWDFNLWLRFIVIFILLALLIYIVIAAMNGIKEHKYIGGEIDYQETIAVEGRGEVYARPDVAVVVFSVKNEAKTVASAIEENSQKMNEVIYSVKIQGVEAKDLKTISFNLYPRYEYEEEDLIWPEGKRVLVGYEVIQSLQVKIREMENIGTIIQEATNAGANQAGALSFTIDDEDKHKEEARRLAIEQAEAKAEQLASQLGIKLLGIKSFSESINGVIPGIYRDSADMLEAASPNIEVGQNKIEARVNIIYKIRD